MTEKLKMVTLGGGGGHAQILRGLRDVTNLELTAICTVSDSGGSTGILRKEYGKFGVKGYLGDVSKCLWALSQDEEVAEGLMYRFTKGTVTPHSVKNLLYAGLIITHGPEKALTMMHKVFQLKPCYRVLPASWGKTNLKVRLAAGQTISGETYIDSIARDKLWDPAQHRITSVWLTPQVRALPEAIRAIKAADFVVVCPGDLFTSVIPVLLVGGIADAVKRTKAKLVFVTNLITKLGETDGYGLLDFIRQLQRRIQNRLPDYVICNNGKIPERLLVRYRRREHKVAILPPSEALNNLQSRFVTADLWTHDALGRVLHDPKKIGTALSEIFQK